MAKIPIIMDVDTGLDDAMALMYACKHPALELLGVTASFGNTTLKNTLQNTLNTLKLCGREDIPVAAGAEKAMVYEPHLAEHVHGAGGIGGYQFPFADTKEALSPLAAWDLTYQLIMKCQEKVTLCYMGPLTTAAILLQKYPAVKERIKAVVFMGGHIREGTYTPLSSVNIYYDPHAAKQVITSGIDFYMCAGDMTSNFCYVTPEEIEAFGKLRSPVGQAVYKLMTAYHMGTIQQKYYGLQKGEGVTGQALHDPATMVFLTNPELFTYGRYYADVEIHSKLAMAMTVVDYQDTLKKPLGEKHLFYVDEMVDREGLRDTFYQVIKSYEEEGEEA